MKIGTISIPRTAALAPMAGVADRAFRELCRDYGSAVSVGEMVSAKGLCYGDRKSGELLVLGEAERPGAVQLFGDDPDILAEAARRAREEYRTLYNEEFAKKYASKAARRFGTTSRFDLAGYLTVNGALLDFSQRQGYRVQDHREIAGVLDFLPEYAEYSDGMIEFMNLGNIRMQSYGIDISKAPNSKQRSALRRFFSSLVQPPGRRDRRQY